LTKLLPPITRLTMSRPATLTVSGVAASDSALCD
jgi:hypothetical protein